jgi:hypothetical protein
MSSELVKIMNIPITREKQMMQATDSSKTVDEDFYTFEKRFVADSLFQMSRIIFSDLGYKGDDDPEAPAVKLSPENWSLFKKTFSDVRKMGQYKTDMKLTSDKCEQTIWIENSSFMLMYTYYCCPVNMCKGLQSLIFLLYKPPLERELTAVRGNVVFETLHDFYRTAII